MRQKANQPPVKYLSCQWFPIVVDDSNGKDFSLEDASKKTINKINITRKLSCILLAITLKKNGLMMLMFEQIFEGNYLLKRDLVIH